MTIRIGYFSDLHTELKTCPRGLSDTLRTAYQSADVIVAAGDIGIGLQSIQFLADTFPDKDVLFVPGNHEYWGSNIRQLQQQLRQACDGTRIHYLDCSTIEIEGVLFHGATLWTDLALTGREPDASAMPDLRHIAQLTQYGLLERHRRDLESIRKAMRDAAGQGKPLVAVTHHAPSGWSLVSDYDRPAMMRQAARFDGYGDADAGYASHLDELMLRHDAPRLWIHGHTHVAVDYQIGTCRIVSNQKGYGKGEDTDWLPGRMVDLRRISLSDLLDKCDSRAAVPAITAAWDNAAPIGVEVVSEGRRT